MRRIFVGMILAATFGATAAECPSDRSAPIRDGHFGARNVRAYNVMISLQVRGRLETLNRMIEDGTVIRLPAGQSACIQRDVATSSRTWVTVPDHEGTFWVHASALDR